MPIVKKLPKKSSALTSKNNHQAETATQAAYAITQAIARSGKFGNTDGKINIHIHVGDVILIGFDEAIDAEEWGMRENNTEIIGGKASKAKSAVDSNKNNNENNEKKIARSINFRKGALELIAVENSEPASKTVRNTKSSTARSVKKTVRK